MRARNKKYRNRFNVEEEAALVSFWYEHRLKYSPKSKILWQLAVRTGVTNRDPVSVQKHFEYNITHGRMHQLFRNFRSKGYLQHVIDSIDVDQDFSMFPLPDPLSGSTGDSSSMSPSEQGSGANFDIEGGNPRPHS
jgi:hypothetical protein